MINQEFPAVHPIGKNDTAIEMAIRRSSERDTEKGETNLLGFWSREGGSSQLEYGCVFQWLRQGVGAIH